MNSLKKSAGTKRFQRLKELFRAAVDYHPGERAAFLEKACPDNPGLRAELEELLDSDSSLGDFLETPATTGLPPGLSGESLAGIRIGQYLLNRVISSGGMGTVYEAEQEHPRRTVAVKVMKEGIVEKSVLRRFEYEAHFLAKLRHPGIAQVIESGTHGGEGGVPYLVMELIPDALPITDYAWLKKLSVKERLELFSQVCDAVQHGHQKGVIHRDLKPANILVDTSGQVKVIDFGIARATDSDLALTTKQTDVGQLLGTVQYMSPEQCKADPNELDVRSDVYALGVVLYELLCKDLPYDVRHTAVFEAARIIRESPPKRPSTADRMLRGDIETIVLKALEKERGHRYQSVADFGSDILRYLGGEVILARPAGPATKVWKRVKRNPVVSGAVGVAVLAVVVLLTVVPWIVAKKEREKRIATEEQRSIADREKRRAVIAEITATEAKNEAQAQYGEILRLSDIRRLNDLKAEAENLWPAHPDKIDAMKDWLKRARELAGRLDLHRDRLEALRAEALPYDDEARRRDREGHPLWEDLLNYRERMISLKNWLAETEAGKPSSRSAGEIREFIADRKEKIKNMEQEVIRRRTWALEDGGKEWQHDILTELVAGLETLLAEESGLVKDMTGRLAFAESVYAESIEKHDASWAKAIASIASREECPFYDGLMIETQIGLVPLGRDPDSGLWEFGNLQTGELPERGLDGRLRITEESGLVFVLIPGGTFDMGAVPPTDDNPLGNPNVDPMAGTNEGPVHTVTVPPFFMSKYEMMQGQWLRFTGINPSILGVLARFGTQRHTLLHPVENVSWDDCIKVLLRLGLRLPSESEWEYATRARTSTIWWTGNDKESLIGAVNIVDRYSKLHGAPQDWTFEEWLDDGYVTHAPVDRYRANAFGLHNVSGNVLEWCQDSYLPGYKDAPADGTPKKYAGAQARVVRGGNWKSIARFCRSAYRHGDTPDFRYEDTGVRPARSLDLGQNGEIVPGTKSPTW